MKKTTRPIDEMDWREAVEFLIRFVTIEDPEKLRPGDRLNLFDDLRRYLEIKPDDLLAIELKRLEQEPKLLVKTINAIRTLIEFAAERRGMESNEMEFKLKAPRRLVFRRDRLGTRGAVTIDSKELHDTMIECASDDLGDAEPWQICRCAEPECRKAFIAGRKGQKFCSHTCANIVAGRVYRKDHATERAAREKSRYQQKRSGQSSKEA